MPLVLGSLTLQRVTNFRIVKAVTYPQKKIPAKSTGKIDPDSYVRDSDNYTLTCELNDSDRQTLQNTYLNTIQSLTDSGGLNEEVYIEKVECEYFSGYDYNSDFCWRCTATLIQSNT